MKTLMWRLCLLASLAGLAVLVRATPSFAAEERGQDDRLELTQIGDKKT